MVRRLLALFHREFNGLHEAAFLLGASALGSQLLALWRDHLLAATFGAGRELDIYYAAFRLPDILFVTIASFVSVTVLIPLLLRHLNANETTGAWQLVNQILTVFCAVMLVVIIGCWFAAPKLVPLVAPGFDPAARATLVQILRLLLWSPLLLGLSNILAGITQTFRYFFVYALSPVVYNLGIIFGVWYLAPRYGLVGLGWGVLLGAFLHGAIQLPVLLKLNFWPHFTTHIDWLELRRVIQISLPRTIGLATQQLTLFILVSLASLVSTGAVAVFTLAFNLQSVPLAIIGVSYSVAAFPALVKSAGAKHQEFRRQVETALRHIIFWSVPATVLFIVLRAHLVRVILGAGRFDWQDTRLVAAALALFTISVTAQSLMLVFVRSYYASGLTKKPVIINLAAAVLAVAAAYGGQVILSRFPASHAWFDHLLRVNDVPGTAMLALPLGFTIGALVNLWLHWYYFGRDFGSLGGGPRRVFWQVGLASLVGGGVVYLMLRFLEPLFSLTTFWGVFNQGWWAGLAGVAVMIGLLLWLRNPELTEVGRAFQRKFWRADAIAPEPEEL